MFSGSWKTSAAGYITLAIAILMGAQAIMDEQMPDTESIIAALVGVGLIQARDHDKSSEDEGIK
jgi:uncharacterized membrane protein YkvI